MVEPLRVLVSPDKFAGTMSAAVAAEAIRSGWLRDRPQDDVRVVPMADGGAGSLDAIAAGPSASEVRWSRVQDPLGRRVAARWLRMEGGVAFIEVAEACGLERLEPSDRDPMRTTSRGVGELIRDAAADPTVTRIVVGLGGSATVDGGVGAMAELGHQMIDRNGRPVPDGGAALSEVAVVDRSKAVALPDVAVAADVNHALADAARVFAPQKGADPVAVRRLAVGLENLADVVERDCFGGPWRHDAGTGAAGGLGFTLRACLGADIVKGAAVIADLLALEQAISWADIVITGEGSLDEQSLAGKAPVFVAAAGRAANRPVYAIAGHIEDSTRDAFAGCMALGSSGLTEPIARTEVVTSELARLVAEAAGGSRKPLR